MSLQRWKPPRKRTYEDKLLLKYWREVGGVIFTEVRVGKGGVRQWPDGSRPRLIDAVRIIRPLHKIIPADIITYRKKSTRDIFTKMVNGATVEVIEAKRRLNRPVIGQAIVAKDLLRMEYRPASVRRMIVCGRGDPVLEIICKKRKVRVQIFEKNKMVRTKKGDG